MSKTLNPYKPCKVAVCRDFYAQWVWLGVGADYAFYIDSLYKVSPKRKIFNVTKSNLHHEMDRGCKASGAAEAGISVVGWVSTEKRKMRKHGKRGNERTASSS